jgi:hypothetical protein
MQRNSLTSELDQRRVAIDKDECLPVVREYEDAGKIGPARDKRLENVGADFEVFLKANQSESNPIKVEKGSAHGPFGVWGMKSENTFWSGGWSDKKLHAGESKRAGSPAFASAGARQVDRILVRRGVSTATNGDVLPGDPGRIKSAACQSSRRGPCLGRRNFFCVNHRPILRRALIRDKLTVFPESAAAFAMCEASGGHEERLRET